MKSTHPSAMHQTRGSKTKDAPVLLCAVPVSMAHPTAEHQPQLEDTHRSDQIQKTLVRVMKGLESHNS